MVCRYRSRGDASAHLGMIFGKQTLFQLSIVAGIAIGQDSIPVNDGLGGSSNVARTWATRKSKPTRTKVEIQHSSPWQ